MKPQPIRRYPLTLTLIAALGWTALSGCGESPVTPEARPQTILSTFADGPDGWTAMGDYTGFRTSAILTPQTPRYPHLRAHDRAEGETFYFRCSPRFLGDREAYYGGRLRYDARAGMGVNPLGEFRDGERFAATDIILVGGGLTLHYRLRPGTEPRSRAWTRVTATLSEGQGWVVVGPRSRRSATEEQMRTVLANLVDIRIRGEYFTGVDWGAIGSVMLVPAR